jgi:hypothetical protein
LVKWADERPYLIPVPDESGEQQLRALLEADQQLDQEQRDLLLFVYREFTRTR